LDSGGTDTRDFAQPLRFGFEAGLSEEAPDVSSGIIRVNVELNKAVSAMTKPSLEEITILGEKSHSLQAMKEHQYRIIGDGGISKLEADLPHGDAGLPQEIPLQARDVLIQEIHAAKGCFLWLFRRVINRPSLSSQALPASRTASAMPSLEMWPPHWRCAINSQSFPLATSLRTCQTMMRVPLNVGLP
jgi:hypothetical protein